jgi:hypothetical protein
MLPWVSMHYRLIRASLYTKSIDRSIRPAYALLLRESFGLAKSTSQATNVPHRASPKSTLLEITRCVEHVPTEGISERRLAPRGIRLICSRYSSRPALVLRFASNYLINDIFGMLSIRQSNFKLYFLG